MTSSLPAAPGLRRLAIAAALAASVCAGFVMRGEAHKLITSKYTYNDDVYPILMQRCGRCHVDRGIAPMSLTSYKDAVPWVESIRAELLAGHMPPANAEDGFSDLKPTHALTAEELDVVLTWASGGNPQGHLNDTVPAVDLKNDWAIGAPDLTMAMPSDFSMPADQGDLTQEFTLATRLEEPRWVRAVDLLPGNASVVRSAVIYLKTAGGAPDLPQAPDRILALWLPGHDPEPLANGVGFRLPAAAELGVRVHYKKPWQLEGQAIADRSTVGLYFAPAGTSRELLALSMRAPAAGADGTVTFTRTLDQDFQVVAVRTDGLPPNISAQVIGVRPDGTRLPILRLNTRADWVRRYWLASPLDLPRGSRIEVSANLENPDRLMDPSAAAARPASPPPLSMMIDVVPAQSQASAPLHH